MNVRHQSKGKHISAFINRIAFLVLIALLGLTISCSKDSNPVDGGGGVEPPVDTSPQQYGDPFENVPATSDIALYEVNVQDFSQQGDLPGVTARLDSIKSLGINVVWLMPIYPIGEEKAVGSPYAVKNYTQVKTSYGTLDDLRELVTEAHNRDMAVILDWVANHTAWDNPWIQNPTWYVRDNAGNIQSPNGWNDVAELNYGSTAMRKEMIKDMKYWVLEANVDGFRCDYADGVPVDFWSQAIDTLRSIPDRSIIMFAEGSDKNLFAAGFNMTFGWNYYGTLLDVFNNNASSSALFSTNASEYSGVPEGSEIVRWITNHDQNAWDGTPMSLLGGQSAATAAFVLASYMDGVPLIYNGQEIGYPRQLSFFSGDVTTIDWSLNPDIKAEYKSLMAFRQSSDAVKHGSLQDYTSSSEVSAFMKTAGTAKVFVLVNVRNADVTYQVPSALVNSTWTDGLTGASVTLGSTVNLSPWEYLVLKN